MKLLMSIALGLGAITEVMALATPKQTVSEDQNSLSEVIKGLKTVSTGLLHVGADAILRSYDGDGKVIDYARVDTAQLKAIMNRYSKEDQERLQGVWANVDSSLVDEEQIWNPPQHLISPLVSGGPSVNGQSKPRRPNVLAPEWFHFCSEYNCHTAADCAWHDRDCHNCIALEGHPIADCAH
ncbi:hypothetical protein EMCG_08244 [[Emmonsia] crescens]|uniref:Uncharacterized protein n=1 Tax=[Emmonsia] crescens TaxID=73230 RepID=A0A0G2JAM5_9EURO|nr:hypothetical protein EMCG_08244 [Emmonsia crescens UAMH 3008]